ncbi:MAG: hypothetical protein LH468_00745 [Nocardioides sp.]|nr:hypothetical protein [Nocardioides sp.]
MNPVTGLCLGRIAVGVASLVKPRQVAAVLGPTSPQASPLMTQWFGTRELALGLVTLVSSGSARRHLVVTGMLVDAGDAGTAYLGIQQGTLPRELGWAAVAIAISAVVLAPLGLLARSGPEVARTPAV